MNQPADPRQFGGAGIAPGYDGPCEDCGKLGRSVPDPHGRPVSITLCEECERSYSGGFGAPFQWLILMLVLVGLSIAAWWYFK